MATEKDIQIFCSGVTQYAMSSGKFDLEDLPKIADTAYDWFVGKFGKPTAYEAPVRSPSPSASQGPQAANAPGRVDWHAGAQAVAAGGGDIPPEAKSFNLWGGDLNYLYGREKETWADVLGKAQEGDDAARQALEKQAKAGLGKDPNWHEANKKRIARAKACLAMLHGSPG